MKAIVYKDDLGKEQDVIDIPEHLVESAKAAREHLLEEASHFDDSIVEMILEDAEVPVDQLKVAIRKATLANSIVPVMCGSSFKNKGVQPLLDAVIDYLPSPLDVPPMVGVVPNRDGSDGDEATRARLRRRAVRGARLQDHGRPVLRQAHLLPRLLRPPQRRRQGPQRLAPARPSASAAC